MSEPPTGTETIPGLCVRWPTVAIALEARPRPVGIRTEETISDAVVLAELEETSRALITAAAAHPYPRGAGLLAERAWRLAAYACRARTDLDYRPTR